MERKQENNTIQQNWKGGGKILNIFLLAAHKFQPISKNLFATYFLIYLRLNIKNILYYMVVAEVF